MGKATQDLRNEHDANAFRSRSILTIGAFTS